MSDTDNNWRNFYNENTPPVTADIIMDPVTGQGWDPADVRPRPHAFDVDDVWKVDCRGKSFLRVEAYGHGIVKEDGQDLNNNASGNYFSKCFIEGGKGVTVTVKGGSKNNIWEDCVFVGRGKHCDYEQDNHSDQSSERSSGNQLKNCYRRNGESIRIAWGRGGFNGRPQTPGTKVTVVWWWVAALHAYNFYKDHIA